MQFLFLLIIFIYFDNVAVIYMPLFIQSRAYGGNIGHEGG